MTDKENDDKEKYVGQLLVRSKTPIVPLIRCKYIYRIYTTYTYTCKDTYKVTQRRPTSKSDSDCITLCYISSVSKYID